MKSFKQFLQLVFVVCFLFSCEKESSDFDQRTLTLSVSGTVSVYTIAGMLSTRSLNADDLKESPSGYPNTIELVSEEKAVLKYNPDNGFFGGFSINATYISTDSTQVFDLSNGRKSTLIVLLKDKAELKQYVGSYEYVRKTEYSSSLERSTGLIWNPLDTSLPKTLVGNDTLTYTKAILIYK